MPCRMSFPAVGSSRVVFWAQLHQPVLPVGVAGGGLHHGMVQPHIMGAMLAKNLSPMFVTGEVRHRILSLSVALPLATPHPSLIVIKTHYTYVV